MALWKQVVGDATAAVARWTGSALRKSDERPVPAGSLPGLPGSVRQMLGRVYDSARSTFDQDPVRVVVVGPVNSGKSTLVNALTGRPVARVSPIPGTTREALEVSSGPFALVDTPGVNEALHEEREEQALRSAEGSDLIVAVFNATVGITQQDIELYNELFVFKKPLVVALNKIDAVGRRAEAVVAAAQGTLGCPVIPISALRGSGMEPLVQAMIAADARVLNVVSDLLPRYRRTAARSRIASASAVAAAIAWEPLPLADVIPLTVLQALMVLDIGKVYGYRIGFGRARELLGTFGGGLLLREGFHQLAKLVPGAGDLLSAGYAAAGTAALGAVAILWFESGQTMTAQEARQAYRKTLSEYASRLRELPREGTLALQERVREALGGG